MKKKRGILCLMLAFSLCTTPAAAYQVVRHTWGDGSEHYEVQVDKDFHEWLGSNKATFDAICELPNWPSDLNMGLGGNGFYEGLTIVEGPHGRTFMDKNFNIYELNNDRYTDQVFPFFNGLAGVVRKSDRRIAYINKWGEEVLVLPEECSILVLYGSPYLGNYQDERICVFRYNGEWSVTSFVDKDTDLSAIEYAYVDRNGDYLTEWTAVSSFGELSHLPFVSGDGVPYGYIADKEQQKEIAVEDGDHLLPSWDEYPQNPLQKITYPADLSMIPGADNIVGSAAAPQDPQPEGQVTAEGIRVLIEKCDFDWDDSAAYDITFTNTTDHPIQGSYCLVLYEPAIWRTIYKLRATGEVVWKSNEGAIQQFLFCDLNLAPGGSFKKEAKGLQRIIYSSTEMLWIKFDSSEEKEQFIANSPLWKGNQDCYVILDDDDAKEFFQDTFGITFLPTVDHVDYLDE